MRIEIGFVGTRRVQQFEYRIGGRVIFTCDVRISGPLPQRFTKPLQRRNPSLHQRGLKKAISQIIKSIKHQQIQ